MSSTEAAMWTVEKDPSLRSDFVNVTILDQSPDRARLTEKLETALELLPRLRQRVISPPLRLAPPEWADDPSFDLDYHLRWVAVPAPGTARALFDLAAALAALPFDRARPLWDLTVVEGLEDGRAALLQKVHHTIIDGVGGVKFSMSLLDLERHPEPVNRDREQTEAGPGPERTHPATVLRSALLDTATGSLELARQLAAELEHRARHPAELPETARRIADTIRSVREQALVSGAALSPLMTDRSLRRRFDAFAISLAAAKQAAHELGGTVNDLFVTGVAGALGLYHQRMGQPVEELRMAMPVSLRGQDDGFVGNRFAPARVVVPVSPKDPRARFAAVQERLQRTRREIAFDFIEPVARLVGLLPTSIVVPVARAQTRTIDFVCSNIRGAPVDLYLAGARVEANHPMGPCTGCALNVTTLSYRGNLDMGINVDPAAVTDPVAFQECLDEAFADLLAVAGEATDTGRTGTTDDP